MVLQKFILLVQFKFIVVQFHHSFVMIKHHMKKILDC
jgi:hypothetical protein